MHNLCAFDWYELLYWYWIFAAEQVEEANLWAGEKLFKLLIFLKNLPHCFYLVFSCDSVRFLIYTVITENIYIIQVIVEEATDPHSIKYSSIVL